MSRKQQRRRRSFHVPAPRGVTLLDSLDRNAPLRNKLREIADEKREWAGIPMPIGHSRLIIEPTYQFASLGHIDEKEDPHIKCRNVFWSHKWRCRIAIYEENGKICWAPLAGTANHATALLNTIAGSMAWGIEQESRAVQLLGSLLTHTRFKQYMLTGMFIETSKRSGVTYIFRRLRPTVAIRADEKESRILCCLCMHPIGYYAESWAGCMCPTDDVIAHLMLMRADERMFWKRSNQISPSVPESGL